MKQTMLKPLRTMLMAAALTVSGLRVDGSLAIRFLAQTGARAALPDFADLAEQVGPSVVNIRTMEKISTQSHTRPNG